MRSEHTWFSLIRINFRRSFGDEVAVSRQRSGLGSEFVAQQRRRRRTRHAQVSSRSRSVRIVSKVKNILK